LHYMIGAIHQIELDGKRIAYDDAGAFVKGRIKSWKERERFADPDLQKRILERTLEVVAEGIDRDRIDILGHPTFSALQALADRDQQYQVRAVASDVGGLGHEPRDDEHPDQRPPQPMPYHNGHDSEATARILFMQDDLRSAAGGEPCSEDCPSTPETPTPSSRETSPPTWRSRSATLTSPNSPTTTSSSRSTRTRASTTSTSCSRSSA